jgi:hypothetical protein
MDRTFIYKRRQKIFLKQQSGGPFSPQTVNDTSYQVSIVNIIVGGTIIIQPPFRGTRKLSENPSHRVSATLGVTRASKPHKIFLPSTHDIYSTEKKSGILALLPSKYNIQVSLMAWPIAIYAKCRYCIFDVPDPNPRVKNRFLGYVIQIRSVAESLDFYAAPAPGKNLDAAPAPAPTVLYSKTKFLKRTKV